MKTKCNDCKNNPVIVLPESQTFCKAHFLKYFEEKVIRTIKKHNLIEKSDKVAVAFSGGKDSSTTLYILNNLLKKERRNLVAILVDEGIKNYRNKTISDAKKFCKQQKIDLEIISFKSEFGKTLDELVKSQKKIKGQNKLGPCSICGVFRRVLLNRAATRLKITKIATGHNLDDEAQSYFMNQLKVNWKRNAKLGPISGITKNTKFVSRVKPLYFVSEKEVATYSFLMKFPVTYAECPYAKESFRSDVRDTLNELEEKHPGSKHALINSLLAILASLKEIYKEKDAKYCEVCKEPSTNSICNSCSLIAKLGLDSYVSSTSTKIANKKAQKQR